MDTNIMLIFKTELKKDKTKKGEKLKMQKNNAEPMSTRGNFTFC